MRSGRPNMMKAVVHFVARRTTDGSEEQFVYKLIRKCTGHVVSHEIPGL